MFNVEDLRLRELPRHTRDDGDVVIAEGPSYVPFEIARVFTVRAPLQAERGKHAHKLCSQLMVCVHGAVDVVCDDGKNTKVFLLDRGNLSLLVHPGIWNTVQFRTANAVLSVICDRRYEAEDYIRDYGEFLAFRNGVRP